MLETGDRFDPIVYRTPFGQWLFGIIGLGGLAMLAFVGLVAATGGVLSAFGPNGPPATWLAIILIAGFVLAVAAALGVVRCARHTVGGKIALHDDGVVVGGGLVRSILRYESIGVVRLEHPPKTVGRMNRLIIERLRGRPISIWLRMAEAHECFAALRDLCDQAASVGLSGDVQMPADPRHQAVAHLALAASLLRKARACAVLCLLLGLWWGVVFTGGVIFGGYSKNPNPRAISFMVLTPLAVLGAATASLRYHRLARYHRAQKSDRMESVTGDARA